MVNNPYFHRGPIRDGNYFYGRKTEIRQIANFVRGGQCISLVGSRKIGKTSLLFQVLQAEKRQEHDLPTARFIMVYLDCEGLGDSDASDFFHAVLEETQAEIDRTNLHIKLKIPKGTMTFTAFRQTLQPIRVKELKLVLILDEFERLAANTKLGNHFYEGLRSLNASSQLVFITASRRSLLELTSQEKTKGSPFFNIFAKLDLGLFAEEEAHSLVTEPNIAAGLTISEGMVAQIIGLVGRQPFFLQIACFHLFEMLTTNTVGMWERTFSFNRLQDLVVVELEGHYKWYWDDLHGDEFEAMSLLVEPAAITEGLAAQEISIHLIDDVRVLERRGLVESILRGEEIRYRPVSQSWAEFVIRQKATLALPILEITPKFTLQPEDRVEKCYLTVHLGYNGYIMVDIEGGISYTMDSRVPSQIDERAMADYNDQLENLVQLRDWKTAAKRLGLGLYEKFIANQPQVSRALAMCLGRITHPSQLHLRFRLERQYLGLPFELLHDDQNWLALSYPMAKYVAGLPIKRRMPSYRIWENRELRILLVGSNVSGQLEIDHQQYSLAAIPGVDEEITALTQLIEKQMQTSPNIKLKVLTSPEATYQRVCEELQQGDYHILHYAGHAFYEPKVPEDSALVFRDGNNAIQLMNVSDLRSVLRESDLRFVYFSCCEGAQQGRGSDLVANDFLGIMDGVLETGVPAVLGYRWAVEDNGAKTMTLTFYQSLFEQGELDVALLKARQTIAKDLRDITWLSPVLVVQR